MVVGRMVLKSARRTGGGGVAPLPPLPQGVIAIWTGTLATIPANWSLCDGTGGTPNLIARFIRGAPAATNPGTTGGADNHGHASMTAAGAHTHSLQNQNHSHTVNAAGNHDHGAMGYSGGSTSVIILVAGAHQHTTSVFGHTHSTDDPGNHTHVINTADGRPPYYEVAFIQTGVGAVVAANLVIIWTGLLANIPAGWSLCDGGGGRPDLRTRFVRGVNTNVTNPGTTGGSATHLHTEVAVATHSHTSDNDGAHTHTFSAYTWTHNHNWPYVESGEGEYIAVQIDTGAGDHTHADTNDPGAHNHNPMGDGGGHSHTVNTASSLPEYYDVAYIINDGGATSIPTNGILIWTGLLANIPAGYSLCDGGGGSPDLRERFTRGSAAGVNPGGTGGSDTHTHTDQSGGIHSNHTRTTSGAHQHNATDTIGDHTHNTSPTEAVMGSGGAGTYEPGDLAGAHSHTFNNENNHTHTLSSTSSHNHNPWSTDDGRPDYYEVAFIIKT